MFCDCCHEPSTDAHMAMALIPPVGQRPSGEPEPILHTHKAYCTDLIEFRCNRDVLTEELATHLTDLAGSCAP